MGDVDTLTPAEEHELERLEGDIRRGLKTVIETGGALALIRDRRLYRAEFTTFASYLQERWGISRSRGYQMIEAAVVASTMSTFVDTVRITNEGQARALAPVLKDHGPEVAAEVLQDAADEDGLLTAAQITEAASNVIQLPVPGEDPDQVVDQLVQVFDDEQLTEVHDRLADAVLDRVQPTEDPEPVRVRVVTSLEQDEQDREWDRWTGTNRIAFPEGDPDKFFRALPSWLVDHYGADALPALIDGMRRALLDLRDLLDEEQAS